MTTYETLIIEHNHGAMVLRDVVLEPYTYTPDPKHYWATGYSGNVARGRVVSGGYQNRLFSAVSSHSYEVGKEETYDLYGKMPYKRHDGVWVVSMVSCG